MKLRINIFILFYVLQLIFIVFYLSENIIIIGKKGVYNNILICFFIFGLFIFMKKNKIFLDFTTLSICFFILYLSFKVIIDLGDDGYLKQITIGTTGGILLFYFIGYFCALSFNNLLNLNKKIIFYFFIFIVSISLCYIIYCFYPRIRTDLFLLRGINGAYQRPGNFLSILFFMHSFLFFMFSLFYFNKKLSKKTLILIYSFTSVIYLLLSQLIASNSSTAVIIGINFITTTMMLIMFQKDLFLHYVNNKIKIIYSKKFILRFISLGFLYIISIGSVAIFLILFFNLNINKLRVFGFGSHSNNSILSRMEIIFDTGIQQITYAPILGDMNVAFYVTGIKGRYLHNFIPNIISQLGLIGFLIITYIFSNVFYRLYSKIIYKNIGNIIDTYKSKMLNLYFLLIMLYIFIFANLATSMSWSVIWFAIGFINCSVNFNKNNN
ncbi:MAG TPA: hypothetical protein ACHBX0_09530 [Arsenophonus sp.]